MKNKTLLMYSWVVRTLLYYFPDIPFFMRFRGWLYGLGMKSCGKNFQVTHNSILRNLQNISIGSDVYIANFSLVMGSGEIIIEDEVLIGPSVVIVCGNHTLIDGSYRYGNVDTGITKIGRGAWVAANCTVGKDSILPSGSVLSANSFLNKQYTSINSIYGGVPAKFLRYQSN